MPNSIWYGLLGLAQANGWQPRGTLAPAWVDENGKGIDTTRPLQEAVVMYSAYQTPRAPISADDEWPGTYDSNDGQCVTAEDAAALAAALGRAVRAKPSDAALASWAQPVIEVCRLGGFIIV